MGQQRSEYRRRQPVEANDKERAAKIARLRRAGWSWERIGGAVGLSANGARYLWQRISDPERWRQRYTKVGEGDPVPPRRSEEW